MTSYKLISADSHIVEPPDLYTKRIEPRLRDRAPRLERLETPTGRKFDAAGTKPMPAGSYIVHYANGIHYDGAKDGDAIIALHGVGPVSTIPAEDK